MRRSVRIYYALILVLFFTEIMLLYAQNCSTCGVYGRCLNWETDLENSTRICNLCACPTGINGTCCQEVPTPCDPDPCGDNQDCVVLSVLHYECKCGSGFWGIDCNDTLIECQTYTTPESIEAQRFTQIIENEWSSSSIAVDWWTETTSAWTCQDCQQMSCQNNGTCSYNSSNNAVCICDLGYTGDTCEVREGCIDNPCLNGGLCVNSNETDYECQCLSIYNGTNCEEFVPCAASPCQNGTCIELGDGAFECDCTLGFNGTFCEDLINMCDPNPCSYNATCSSLINDYECDCPANSGGKNCSDITDFCQSQVYSTICNANDTQATCEYSYQNFTCTCSDYWAGDYCNITSRVNAILPYFPNATTDTILFLEAVSNNSTLIQFATTYIAATLENLTDTSWYLDEIFEWTAFMGREFNFTEEFDGFTDPTIGNCFTFNHPKSKTLFKVDDSGEDNGLSMMLKVQQDEYLENFEMAAIKIYVHPFNQLIFAESLSFNAMPGASSTLRVAKSTHISLGGSYGDCAATSKDVNIYYYIGNYSVDACLWSCYQARLYSVCGCMDPRYQAKKRLQICGIDEAQCVFNFNQLNGDPSTWGVFCDCPSECTKIQYDVQWQGANFPLNPIECSSLNGKSYQNCLADYQDKALVTVYFPDVTQLVFSEEPQWDINTILSYFGGLAGVVMGFSIVSIFEFLYLVYRALLVMCTNESATLDEVEIASISSTDENEEQARKEELEALKKETDEMPDEPSNDQAEGK